MSNTVHKMKQNNPAELDRNGSKAHLFVFCSIPYLSCLSYVVAHVCYFHFECLKCKLAQYDPSCRRALNHHSFLH